MRADVRRCRSKKSWLIDRAWKRSRYVDESTAVRERFGDRNRVSWTVREGRCQLNIYRKNSIFIYLAGQPRR